MLAAQCRGAAEHQGLFSRPADAGQAQTAIVVLPHTQTECRGGKRTHAFSHRFTADPSRRTSFSRIGTGSFSVRVKLATRREHLSSTRHLFNFSQLSLMFLERLVHGFLCIELLQNCFFDHSAGNVAIALCELYSMVPGFFLSAFAAKKSWIIMCTYER